MGKPYQPSEAKIAAVIEKTGGDPRKLAIAYLRAIRRARDAEAGLDVMGDLQDFTLSAMTGDMTKAQRSVEAMKRRIARHEDITREGME